jgi:ATP-dependent RNA helicase DDX49/DBP8
VVFAGANMNLRCSVITGGQDMMKQGAELNEIPHIIVATPGRLADLLKND